jgi:hypothetical protein
MMQFPTIIRPNRWYRAQVVVAVTDPDCMTAGVHVNPDPCTGPTVDHVDPEYTVKQLTSFKWWTIPSTGAVTAVVRADASACGVTT